MPVTSTVGCKVVDGWVTRGGWLAFAMATSLACAAGHEAAKRPERQADTPQAPAESLPPLTVLQRLRGSEAERRACFGASGQATDGFVKLAWDIGLDGRASRVAVEGTSVHDRAVEACLSA